MSETPESLSRTLSSLLDSEPGTYCTYRLHTVWCWEEESSTDLLRRLHCASYPHQSHPCLTSVLLLLISSTPCHIHLLRKCFPAQLRESMLATTAVTSPRNHTPISPIDLHHFSIGPLVVSVTQSVSSAVSPGAYLPDLVSRHSLFILFHLHLLLQAPSDSEDNKDPGETSNRPR